MNDAWRKHMGDILTQSGERGVKITFDLAVFWSGLKLTAECGCCDGVIVKK
jgi:hypothetical protein